MSETVALLPDSLPDSPEHARDTFAQTAADRFDDAVTEHTRRPRVSRLLGPLRRPTVVAAAAWLVLVAIAALAPSLLAPGDPFLGVPADKLQPPSLEHWFGTDQIGRDLYTRVVHGASLTLSAAAVAVAVGILVGAGLGLVAGFAGADVEGDVLHGVDRAARGLVGDGEPLDSEHRARCSACGVRSVRSDGHRLLRSESRARDSRLAARTVRAMTMPGNVVSHQA